MPAANTAPAGHAATCACMFTLYTNRSGERGGSEGDGRRRRKRRREEDEEAEEEAPIPTSAQLQLVDCDVG